MPGFSESGNSTFEPDFYGSLKKAKVALQAHLPFLATYIG